MVTKEEPVDAVASKCPKVFGRLGGGGAQRPQNSADARSDKKLGIGRKKAQDFKRLSFIVICCER
jgi:hypothetical protein